MIYNMILNDLKLKQDVQKMNGILFKQLQLKKHYNLAMLFCNKNYLFFIFNFLQNFRAVRNLHQLVLRQQKVEGEGEGDEIEDPIKRVRQQLDKVNQFSKFKILILISLN